VFGPGSARLADIGVDCCSVAEGRSEGRTIERGRLEASGGASVTGGEEVPNGSGGTCTLILRDGLLGSTIKLSADEGAGGERDCGLVGRDGAVFGRGDALEKDGLFGAVTMFLLLVAALADGGLLGAEIGGLETLGLADTEGKAFEAFVGGLEGAEGARGKTLGVLGTEAIGRECTRGLLGTDRMAGLELEVTDRIRASGRVSGVDGTTAALVFCIAGD